MTIEEAGDPQLAKVVGHYSAYLSTGKHECLRTAVELLHSLKSTTDDILHREYLVDRITLTGWAGLPGQAIDVRRVVACSAERILGSVTPHRRRPDVAQHFEDSRLRRSGFGHTDLVVDQPLDAGPVWVLAETYDHQYIRLRPTDSVLDHEDSPLIDEPSPLHPKSDLFAGHVDGVEIERIAILEDHGVTDEVDLSTLAELLVLVGELDAAQRIVELLPAVRELEVQRGGMLAIATTPTGEPVNPPLADDCTWKIVEIHRPISPTGSRFVDSIWTPMTVPSRRRVRQSIPIDDPYVVAIENAEVHRGSIILDSSGAFVLDERAADPAYDFVAGRWNCVFGSPMRWGEALLRLEKGSRREIAEAASLLGRCSFNYFHALIEYVPRLLAVDRIDPDKSLPALVNDDMPPAATEALEILAGGRTLIPVTADEILEVGRLHIPSFHTFHPDTPALPWLAGSGVHRPTLLEARRRWLDAADAVPGTRKVFLTRPESVRGLINDRSIVRVARQEGFDLVDPSELSFREQVHLIHGSAVISGVGGAGFANLLFSRPGANVIGLVSEQLAGFSIQAHLANLAGAEFTYLVGSSPTQETDVSHLRDHFHADFRVSPRRFRRLLRTTRR